MKRWEPIKTEKKQLGGIIKLLQKVAPKLASKARGRLLASRLKQVKDFKTPYIFPGQLGWSPAETRTVWHRTNNPNFKIKRKFKGRWDAKEHGAPENGLWVSEKKDIGFMNDRPILVQLQQTLKKPMVQIGDIPTQGKNNMRNYILRESEQSGADAVKFQGIKDNKTSNQNVTFIFEPTTSTTILPKEHKVLKKRMQIPEKDRPGFIVPTPPHLQKQHYLDSPEKRLLDDMRLFRKADSGREFMMKYLKSPQWIKRALKHMSKREAQKLGKFESQLIELMNPPKGFKPIRTKLKLLDHGVLGESILPHDKQQWRQILVDPITGADLKYVGVHEAAHASTLNYPLSKGEEYYKELVPEELRPLLDKQFDNAKKLADQLEIDPKRYKETVDSYLRDMPTISEQTVKNLLDNRILYLKDPGEARARGLAAVAYGRTKDIPREIDPGQGIFTKESLDNLYKNIFSIGVPIVSGALTLKQLENEN